ncbi:hypothetical protein EYF80_021799 [Liparis tanakae]|uniref:Uncharacterized protein n=1 Tax=Liparis tanakae TaxID=230148 RepID=A0A4Z2HQL0_9TELE|nr:hypothetical protein EYF80_021799 [Liparis tanakae]
MLGHCPCAVLSLWNSVFTLDVRHRFALNRMLPADDAPLQHLSGGQLQNNAQSQHHLSPLDRHQTSSTHSAALHPSHVHADFTLAEFPHLTKRLRVPSGCSLGHLDHDCLPGSVFVKILQRPIGCSLLSGAEREERERERERVDVEGVR